MRYLNLVKTIANWPDYFAHKWRLSGSPDALFRLRAGGKILVPGAVMHEFKEVFFDEAYVTGLPREVPVGAAVVDIGANIGAFSVFAAGRFPQSPVVAFEPDPVNFAVLAKNAALQGAGRIHPVEAAVAGGAGALSFHRGTDAGVSTSGSLLRTTGEKITVQAVTLAQALDDAGIGPVGLLKMDCEGAEFDILYGASDALLGRIAQMVIEVHDRREGASTRAALSAYLKAKGFAVKDGMHHLLWAWHPAP